jgi:hypothetical protein
MFGSALLTRCLADVYRLPAKTASDHPGRDPCPYYSQQND